MNFKTPTLILLFASFLACRQPASVNETSASSGAPEAAANVGADKDEHGCIGSAGYLWSSVREACVRPWEMGAQFTAYDTKSGGDGVAFVVLSQDITRAEIFFSGASPSVLTKVGAIDGKNTSIRFENKDEGLDISYENETFLIRKNGKPVLVHPYSATSGLGLVIKP